MAGPVQSQCEKRDLVHFKSKAHMVHNPSICQKIRVSRTNPDERRSPLNLMSIEEKGRLKFSKAFSKRTEQLSCPSAFQNHDFEWHTMNYCLCAQRLLHFGVFLRTYPLSPPPWAWRPLWYLTVVRNATCFRIGRFGATWAIDPMEQTLYSSD